MVIVTSSFSKSSIHTKTYVRPAFSNCSGLKGVFEMLCFRVAFVGTVGLTVEIKLRFQWDPA